MNAPPSTSGTGETAPPSWVETPTTQQQRGTDANAAAASSTATRSSIAVACVSCRSRHLKCDGATRCSRCVSENVNCVYLKSRRGWKGPRRSAKATLKQGAAPIVPSMYCLSLMKVRVWQRRQTSSGAHVSTAPCTDLKLNTTCEQTLTQSQVSQTATTRQATLKIPQAAIATVTTDFHRHQEMPSRSALRHHLNLLHLWVLLLLPP